MTCPGAKTGSPSLVCRGARDVPQRKDRGGGLHAWLQEPRENPKTFPEGLAADFETWGPRKVP